MEIDNFRNGLRISRNAFNVSILNDTFASINYCQILAVVSVCYMKRLCLSKLARSIIHPHSTSFSCIFHSSCDQNEQYLLIYLHYNFRRLFRVLRFTFNKCWSIIENGWQYCTCFFLLTLTSFVILETFLCITYIFCVVWSLRCLHITNYRNMLSTIQEALQLNSYLCVTM